MGLSLWNNVCWSGAAVNLLFVDGSKSWRPSCSGDCSHVQDRQSQVWDNSRHLDPEICYQLKVVQPCCGNCWWFKPPPSLALFYFSSCLLLLLKKLFIFLIISCLEMWKNNGQQTWELVDILHPVKLVVYAKRITFRWYCVVTASLPFASPTSFYWIGLPF